MIEALIGFWIVSGAFAYALTFAYFQRKWPSLAAVDRRRDRIFAFIIGTTGPFGLLAALILGEAGKFGFKWK